MKGKNPVAKYHGRPKGKYQRDFTHYFTNHVNNQQKGKKSVKSTNPCREIPLDTGYMYINVNGTYLTYDPLYETVQELIDRINSHPKFAGWGVTASIIESKQEETQPEESLNPEQQNLNQSIMQLKQVLGQKFINVDEVAEILEIGFVANKNVFLYGRGGHAKSEIINEFLKHIDPTGENSFVQACGEGLSEEKLFGGLNLQKFQKTGEIEYLVENSFMNKKFVVFEELLDSRMNVLLSLKDILTSGIFRQGKQQFKIKTEFVICLTNRTKQEVSEDNSIKALLERFPLEMKVEWGRYEAEDYMNMFNKVLNNKLERVATICQSINETGDFISPRTAIHMGQVFQKTGSLAALKYFGATREVIEKVERLEKERQQALFVAQKEEVFGKIVSGNDCSCMESFKNAIKEAKKLLAEIGSVQYTDKVFPTFNTLKGKLEAKIDEYKNGMLNILENE